MLFDINFKLQTENELQQSHLRISTLETEKIQLEEKLSTLNGAHQLAQDHAQQLKVFTFFF